MSDYAPTTETDSVAKEAVYTRAPYQSIIKTIPSLLLSQFLTGFGSKSFDYWQTCSCWGFDAANNYDYLKNALTILPAFYFCEGRALYQLHTSCGAVRRCRCTKADTLFVAWSLSVVSEHIHRDIL